MKITQSFLKQFRGFLFGKTCGNIIRHCWVDGKLLPSSKVMKVGSYFEFNLSGALPKDGIIPVAEFMKSKDEPKVEYRKALRAAKYVKEMLTGMGFKIVHAGKKFTKEVDGKLYEGTVDLVCEAQRDIICKDNVGREYLIKKGQQVVIDLKYSGLLDDRWQEMGWMWTDKQKDYQKIQAIQYHFISGLVFLYCVTDSSHAEKDDEGNLITDPEMKIFHVPVSKRMIKEHLQESNEAEEKFQSYVKNDLLLPRPELHACNKCPLNADCKDRARFPSIEVVDVNKDSDED